MPKKFVIDTSVLLYDIESLFKFADNEVIIPSIVYEELNHLKEEASETGFYARHTIAILEELSKIRPLKDGVYLKEVPECSHIFDKIINGETFIRRDYNIKNAEIDKLFVFDENDYKIIACAKNNNAILISRDRGMRGIGSDFVEVQDYEADKIKTRELYKGYRYLSVPERIITRMHQGGLNNSYGLYPNEFVIFTNELNPNHTSVGIMKNDRIIPCDFEKMNMQGLQIKPHNLEQKMLVYLLLDPDIKCVSAIGVSGKGKSLLAIDYALGYVGLLKFNKFLYTKSIISVDRKEELGFYKGTVEEKLRPHLEPLYNSIEYLYKDKLNRGDKRQTIDEVVVNLIEKDTLRFFPLANIRGMSIFDKVVMLDEAQNTTNHMIKSLVTRITDSSKLIVTGDVEQIDDKNLNKYNNGLSHLIEAGKDVDFIGHITMDIDSKNRRGRLAEFGTNKL